MGVKRGGLAALYMLPILFLGGFYLYPLVSLLRVSFGVPDALQAVAALNSPGVWRLLWFTAWQALLSTALTVLVGVPLAALLGRFTFPGRRLLSALLTVPFVMPAVVVAPAFLALVGNEGVVTGWLQARWQLPRFEQTLGLILWVHVFYNVAIVIRTVGGLWSTLPASLAEAAAVLGARPGQVLWTVTLPLLAPIAHSLIALPFVVRALLPALRALDQRLREAAATLGASPWRRWWTVDAPLLARALLVSAAFAFAISLGEFGATLLIARPDWPTMPMVIYQAFSRPGLLNYGQGLAMSTLLMGVTAASALLIERLRLPGEEEF